MNDWCLDWHYERQGRLLTFAVVSERLIWLFPLSQSRALSPFSGDVGEEAGDWWRILPLGSWEAVARRWHMPPRWRGSRIQVESEICISEFYSAAFSELLSLSVQETQGMLARLWRHTAKLSLWTSLQAGVGGGLASTKTEEALGYWKSPQFCQETNTGLKVKN